MTLASCTHYEHAYKLKTNKNLGIQPILYFIKMRSIFQIKFHRIIFGKQILKIALFRKKKHSLYTYVTICKDGMVNF